LTATRSLGRLLGLDSLYVKVESGQPTGSWLDRSAAAAVRSALGSGASGIGVVRAGVWAVPLAVECARAGLRLVVVEPAASPGGGDSQLDSPVDTVERGWLAVLGARIVDVRADPGELLRAAPSIVSHAGLYPVTGSNPSLRTGLIEVIEEIERAGHERALLAVPNLAGQEFEWLTVAAAERRTAAVPLPLDGLASSRTTCPFAIVGEIASSPMARIDPTDGAAPEVWHDPVLAVTVRPREVEAARRLLAREEGLIVSRRGAAGFAALVRALRADRARRLRERRLRDVSSAVVVVTGEPLRAGDGPPAAADAVASRPVSLSELSVNLARLLVEPPGR
jgi:threonine synthase